MLKQYKAALIWLSEFQTVLDDNATPSGKFLWQQFIGWIAGVALAVAFVIHPLVKMILAVIDPEAAMRLPDVSLAAMWPPVGLLLGIPALRIAQQFMTSREARKTLETENGKCGNCPAKNCDSCPLKTKTAPDMIAGAAPRVVGEDEGV